MSLMDYVGQGIDYLKSLVQPRTVENTAAQARRTQGPGFWQADIGMSDEGKSNEPANGGYEHNSPAKPL